ncbi:hypothetical protein RchiOBHm_Chr3g0493701 [Rosa chinensis]|uniref:Uncharacterized protein n=1 Tax=Rosa chinensis TaxID=74649 RepID=A0A2P6RGU1_ROSCH|nr:hypothetical protein RchiOBHm_Chr3g0493701 [Rosa chinensis]
MAFLPQALLCTAALTTHHLRLLRLRKPGFPAFQPLPLQSPGKLLQNRVRNLCWMLCLLLISLLLENSMLVVPLICLCKWICFQMPLLLVAILTSGESLFPLLWAPFVLLWD